MLADRFEVLDHGTHELAEGSSGKVLLLVPHSCVDGRYLLDLRISKADLHNPLLESRDAHEFMAELERRVEGVGFNLEVTLLDVSADGHY